MSSISAKEFLKKYAQNISSSIQHLTASTYDFSLSSSSNDSSYHLHQYMSWLCKDDKELISLVNSQDKDVSLQVLSENNDLTQLLSLLNVKNGWKKLKKVIYTNNRDINSQYLCLCEKHAEEFKECKC